jgi:transcriptional regulator with XRE-family HTH domain
VSPIEPASPAFACAIRTLREAQQLTQEDVAYDAGITPGTLSRIEGGRANPTWTTVERIAEALDVSLVDLAQAIERAEGA